MRSAPCAKRVINQLDILLQCCGTYDSATAVAASFTISKEEKIIFLFTRAAEGCRLLVSLILFSYDNVMHALQS